MAHYIALACEALTRSIYAAAADAPATVVVELFEQGLHDRPRNLRSVLQAQIDAIPPDACDAILLVYGMCGTATVGLIAPDHTPLVIPRAHDCITLYLGSKEAYAAEFEAHPGTYWYSVDYMEHAREGSATALGAASIDSMLDQYEAYIEKYGQEMADMLMDELRRWSQHYTRAAFINTGLGESAQYETLARAKAEREGWLFERKEGNRRLLRQLVGGDWPEADFLVVPPGHVIAQDYTEGLVTAQPRS